MPSISKPQHANQRDTFNWRKGDHCPTNRPSFTCLLTLTTHRRPELYGTYFTRYLLVHVTYVIISKGTEESRNEDETKDGRKGNKVRYEETARQKKFASVRESKCTCDACVPVYSWVHNPAFGINILLTCLLLSTAPLWICFVIIVLSYYSSNVTKYYTIKIYNHIWRRTMLLRLPVTTRDFLTSYVTGIHPTFADCPCLTEKKGNRISNSSCRKLHTLLASSICSNVQLPFTSSATFTRMYKHVLPRQHVVP